MKKHISIVILLLGVYCMAQPKVINEGNFRIFEEGNIGFHTHLINEGTFDQNLGLAGFYGSSQISISGSATPTFHDAEIAIDQGLYLATQVKISNMLNFISGDMITAKDQKNNFINFMDEADYTGEGNLTKVDGYVYTEQQNFLFPTGDSQLLRPLLIMSEAKSPAKCAYFYENPNFPFSLVESFDTSVKNSNINKIITSEFWVLEGDEPAVITLTWNERTEFSKITQDVNSIVIVGWSNLSQQWVELGNEGIAGTLEDGFITSVTFTPNNYEVLTFGTLEKNETIPNFENYIVSANGDGKNDQLILPGLEEFTNNNLKIYDRYGLKVFEEDNYYDGFDGFSNVNNMVTTRSSGLPTGVYFYIVTLKDYKEKRQGYFYLSR